MAGGVMFDWRGTPIREGRKVITHSRNWNHAVGVVTKLHKDSVTVQLLEHDFLNKDKATLATLPASLTVLTPDLFEVPASE